jgi:hypothetical protein
MRPGERIEVIFPLPVEKKEDKVKPKSEVPAKEEDKPKQA